MKTKIGCKIRPPSVASDCLGWRGRTVHSVNNGLIMSLNIFSVEFECRRDESSFRRPHIWDELNCFRDSHQLFPLAVTTKLFLNFCQDPIFNQRVSAKILKGAVYPICKKWKKWCLEEWYWHFTLQNNFEIVVVLLLAKVWSWLRLAITSATGNFFEGSAWTQTFSTKALSLSAISTLPSATYSPFCNLTKSFLRSIIWKCGRQHRLKYYILYTNLPRDFPKNWIRQCLPFWTSGLLPRLRKNPLWSFRVVCNILGTLLVRWCGSLRAGWACRWRGNFLPPNWLVLS